MDTEKSCDMVMIEAANFDISWECSGCGTTHKATRKFEKSKACPRCGRSITSWVGIDDYSDR